MMILKLATAGNGSYTYKTKSRSLILSSTRTTN